MLKRKRESSPSSTPSQGYKLSRQRSSEVAIPGHNESLENGVVKELSVGVVEHLHHVSSSAAVEALVQPEQQQKTMEVRPPPETEIQETAAATTTCSPAMENNSHHDNDKKMMMQQVTTSESTENQKQQPQQGSASKTENGNASDSALGFGASVASTSQTPPPVVAEVLHTVPSHAGWFSWTKIHTLERQGLAGLFNGTSVANTPELYMEYRNAIVNKYREDPTKVISIADIMQGNLGGNVVVVDEKSIARVLGFLDHWGLVNYQAPEDWLPTWPNKEAADSLLEVDESGVSQALLPQTDTSLYKSHKSRSPASSKQNATSKQSIMKQTAADRALAEALEKLQGPEVEYHCNSCAADCSRQRYHCQKQADFDLCPDCYNAGKFGSDMMSTDFMRMDVTEAADAKGEGWTDQETLLLLEALELYGDNWNEIAEHVATKSKSQCILHFIRLPIEDPFLDDTDTSTLPFSAPSPPSVLQTASSSEGEQKVEPSSEKPSESLAPKVVSNNTGTESASKRLSAPPSAVAFADAGNPVMTQVAFLAALVGRNVATAAAQAALASLTEKEPGPRLAAGTAIVLDAPKVKELLPSGSHPDRVVQLDGELQTAVEDPKVETETNLESGVEDPNAKPETELESGVQGPLAETGTELEFGVQDSKAAEHAESAIDREGILPVPDSSPQKEAAQQTCGDSSPGKECVPKTVPEENSKRLEEDSQHATRVKHAAVSAVAAAAVKAKLLADHEEREMQRLVATIIENQLKKLELKLKTFSELENMIAMECETVEHARQRMYSEHAQMLATCMGTDSNNSGLLARPSTDMLRPSDTLSNSGAAVSVPVSLPTADPSSITAQFAASFGPGQSPAFQHHELDGPSY